VAHLDSFRQGNLGWSATVLIVADCCVPTSRQACRDGSLGEAQWRSPSVALGACRRNARRVDLFHALPGLETFFTPGGRFWSSRGRTASGHLSTVIPVPGLDPGIGREIHAFLARISH